MKEIKWIAESIEEELEDAEKYAKAALYNKHTDPEMSKLCADLAKQELMHSELLHNQAVKLIKAQTDKGVVAPPAMLAVWDWQHERMIEHTAKIKTLLAGM